MTVKDEEEDTRSFNVFYEQEMMEQEEDEKHLFRDLNAFIGMISAEEVEVERTHSRKNSSSSITDLKRKRSLSLKDLRKKVEPNAFQFLRRKNSSLSSLLRLHLLNYLRSVQTMQHKHNFPLVKEIKKREILLQWWITLLNFLSSKLKFDFLLKTEWPEEVPDTELISIVLEAISRIITLLIVLPNHNKVDHEVYAQHLNLTIKFVSDILIVNSRIQKKYTARHSSSASSFASSNIEAETTFSSTAGSVKTQSNGNICENAAVLQNSVLSMIDNYNSFLTTFIGKVNAYAFVYLPDECHFEYLILSTWYPRLRAIRRQNSLFPWKETRYQVSRSPMDSNTKKYFSCRKNNEHQKICASYMKNKSIFLTFYWHYWYIVLRYSENISTNCFTKGNTHQLPGAELLLNFIVEISFKVDLRIFDKFVGGSPMRTSRKGKGNSTSSGLYGDDIDGAAIALAPSSKRYLRNETVNDFIFTNFGTIKLWETIRSVAGCMKSSKNVESMLGLHDLAILKQVRKIPSHDYTTANLVYNKIFQFIIFQFNSLPSIKFIHWEIWIQGLMKMLENLNTNSQTVALISFFNMWPYLNVAKKQAIIEQIVLSEKYWTLMLEESQSTIIRILFIKFVVFRAIPSMDMDQRNLLALRLHQIELQMNNLFGTLKKEGYTTDIPYSDPFAFALNNRFVIVNSRCYEEDYLTFEFHQRPRKPKLIAVLNNDIYPMEKFPNIGSVSNVRPTYVLKKGRYPYDVFDELLEVVAKNKSSKKWGIRNDIDDGLEDLMLENFDEFVTKCNANDQESSVVKALTNKVNMWFSGMSVNEPIAESSNVNTKDIRPSTAPTKTSEIESQNIDQTSTRSSVKSSGGWSFGFSSRKNSSSSIRKFSDTALNSKAVNLLKIGSTKQGNSHSAKNNKVFESLYGHLLLKQKVIFAPEFTFSQDVLSNPSVVGIIKAIQLHPEKSLNDKLDIVNRKWGSISMKNVPSNAIQVEEIDKNDINVLEIPLTSSSNSMLSEGQELDQSSSDTFGKDVKLPKLDYEKLELGTNIPDEDVLQGVSQESNLEKDGLPSIMRMRQQTAFENLIKIIRIFNATKDEFLDYRDDHEKILIEFELYRNGYQSLLAI